jgi:hypothetical protein
VVKKCPNCETDLPKDQETCPDCGKAETVKNTKEETADPKNNVEQTNFPDTELNDPIEWSELKDLPVESVMELFHQSETAGDATANENDKLTEADIKFLKKKQKQSKNDDQEDPKDDLEDDSILAAYIRAHREDTDREQAEELLKRIHEKVQTENTENTVSEESSETDSSQKNEEPAAETSEELAETPEKAEEAAEPMEEAAVAEEPETVQNKEENQVQAEKEPEESISEEPAAAQLEEHQVVQEPAEDVAAESAEEAEQTKEPEAASEPVEEAPAIEEETLMSKAEEPAAPEVLEEKIEEPETIEPEPIEPETSEQEVHEDDLAEKSIPVPEPKPETASKQPEPKPAPRKKNRKKWYGLAAAIILLSAGGWAFYDNQQKVQAEKAAAIEQRQREVDQMENQLLSFYYDDAHEYIRTDMLGQDLTKLKEKLETFKDEKEYPKMEKNYQDIESKIKLIHQTNELFTAPVIQNDKLAENPLLKADQTVEASELSDTDFDKLISQAQNEAKAQYEQLQEAKKQTAVVYKDKVLDSATREQYDKAKEAVDKIKNPDLAENLKTQLKKVSDTLTAKEKAEKEKKEKEEKEKQEAEKKAQEAAARAAAEAQAKKEQQEQAQKAAQSSSSSSASASQSNPANQPIMATRQSDIADSSNPAWNWAPGVKESVIATAIQRGYIVEGGYTLEKVRIENGEGYYNLFATSTDSALMRGIAKSALPFYIVTINCKTGWFGGNGSN